jgi:enoyl-CoA hydratase/carnithine racemase
MTIKRITEGAVAIILIDRPEKLNALDAEHLTELRGQLANAAADPAVRVIILSGVMGGRSASAPISRQAEPTK